MSTGKPMKILMVAACPFVMQRGKPIRVLNNVAALAMLGHQVDLLTYREGEPLAPALPEEMAEAVLARVTLHRLHNGVPLKDPNKPGLSLAKLRNMPRLHRHARRLIRENGYDCLYCHDIDGALLGERLKRITRLPLVYDMHGSFRELMANIHDSAGLAGRVYGALESRVYRAADVILANWPHLVPVAERHGGAGRVVLVQDKPPLRLIRQLEQPRRTDTLKQRLGLNRVLLYTGNFADYQRVDVLLDMMQRLEQRDIDADLLLAGAGYEAMHQRAEQMGLQRVHFLGPKHGEELAELLTGADVALSPRVTENYPPMKVITYIMARLPTVATDLPSHRQMLEHERTGLLCDASGEAFAGQVERLLTDDALEHRLREAVADEATRYTWDRLLEEIEQGMGRLPTAKVAETAPVSHGS